jgi:dCMP deaminase
MLFCDSQHAERAGIAQAAKTGIPLSGSTLYVSKFPCRDCTMSVIQSGVTTVIFEKDSYGLAEAELLTSNNITLKKVLLPD